MLLCAAPPVNQDLKQKEAPFTKLVPDQVKGTDQPTGRA